MSYPYFVAKIFCKPSVMIFFSKKYVTETNRICCHGNRVLSRLWFIFADVTSCCFDFYSVLFYYTVNIGRICRQQLTLILPIPKVISLCQQYRARPACTFLQSDQALFLWLPNCQVLILIILNFTRIDSSKIWKMDFSI